MFLNGRSVYSSERSRSAWLFFDQISAASYLAQGFVRKMMLVSL